MRYLLLTLTALLALPVAADELPERMRRHSDGPIQLEDFQGKLPDSSELFAETFTHLYYDYEFEWKTVQNEVQVEPKRIVVFATIDRKKNWMRDSITSLLDHEQGHFDLTQIVALEQSIKFAEAIRDGKGPVGKGYDRESATADLRRQLDKVLDEALAAGLPRQRKYDQITRHGQIPQVQAAQRRAQREELASLTKQLETLAPKKAKTSGENRKSRDKAKPAPRRPAP